MSPRSTESLSVGATLPRGILVADAWLELGASVAPLSNASGRPLARTVKLILDPLVLRPTHNPHLASGLIRIEHVDELRRRIADAGPTLAATAAWFLLLKRARRRAAITGENPQDLYFQRCFELGRAYGMPDGIGGGEAERIALDAVTEIRDSGGEMTVRELRRFVTDPRAVSELRQLLDAVWGSVAPDEQSAPTVASVIAGHVAAVLENCATDVDGQASEAFDILVSTGAGTREAVELRLRGVARSYGLTEHPVVAPPVLGDRASKNALPKPFDRSILERLFAGFTSAFQRQRFESIPDLAHHEIARSAAPWQLSGEPSRVVMAIGRDASATLGVSASREAAPTDARSRLQSRWEREAYVHRVLRLPDAEAAGVPAALREDIASVREAYLRRLWVRLHGRELRHEDLDPSELWNLLDGVLRSVIMDQRDRLKAVLERHGTLLDNREDTE